MEKKMNPDLLLNLINISVIKPGTEIAILRYGTSMDGSKTATLRMKIYSGEDKNGNQNQTKINANHIVEVYECGIDSDNIPFMKVYSTVDGKKFILRAKDVKLIDHMLPEKIAAIYGFKPDGTKKKQGKKRGRKPKIRE